MWRPWRNISPPTAPKDNHHNHHHNHHPSKLGDSPRPPPSPSLSPSLSNSSAFRCSSFKDIESLCLDSSSDDPSSDPPPPSRPVKCCLPQSSTPRRSVYHRARTAKALLRQWSPLSDATPKSLPDPDPAPVPEKPRVTVYYTSLRVVRPTFEACRSVLSVLQGFRVAMDQRDVAMDASFMSELRERIGSINSNDDLRLPRVFIGNQYIGGAEEVLDLNEIGELKKMVQGLPAIPLGTCQTCGGYKFVMCVECNGSRKIYSDKTGFRLCTVCNENGLIRCPQCSCLSPPCNNNPSTAFLNASS